ncbi:CU044_2847 family protein [Micromonospora chersina]|uniref:CU044_2847 family protein n=1 Tax=Micromonospora chersina TaxID=47854 RepID=UPI0033FA991C
MSEVVPVEIRGVEFYAEVVGVEGPANVGLNEVMSFDGVRQTIEAIATELTAAWRTVRPDEAAVEFSLTLKVKEGKLSGLLVSGGAEGSLKVSLRWTGAKAESGGSAND